MKDMRLQQQQQQHKIPPNAYPIQRKKPRAPYDVQSCIVHSHSPTD